MTTFTPNMDLILPDIATFNTLGTLPQDWALYLNSNVIIIDGHEHAEVGKQVPASAMVSTSDLDLNQISIEDIQYLTFSSVESPINNLSLYTDGTDLFWQDGEGITCQITIGGALNVVTTIGGFFGDYAASGAIASYDSSRQYFVFQGPAPTNPDTSTVKVSSLQFTETAGGQTFNALTMDPALLSVQPGILNIAGTFPKRSIATNAAGVYEFSNVVGDGSPYSSTLKNVPITDPNGIYHLNSTDFSAIPGGVLSPNLCWGARPELSRVNQKNENYIELFASSVILPLTGSNTSFLPGEAKTFTITHSFPLLDKIPHWNGTYSVNFCKWALAFTTATGVPTIVGYDSLKAQIETVKSLPNKVFEVRGQITNVSAISLSLASGPAIYSLLRLAAVFPNFNAEGVFFDEQY